MGGAVIISPQGSIINNNYYWGDSILNLQSVGRYSDNEYYFVTGYQKDSCTAFGALAIPYTHPLVGRMDSMGNIMDLHYYELIEAKCWNLASDLEITSDKSVITWGGGGIGIQWSFFVLKADSVGDVVWAKQFNSYGSFQFIKELPGGDLLAGINMDTAGAVVARLGANGNFLWCKSYIRPHGMVQDCLIESDSSFIITGTTDSLASTNIFDPLPPGYHPKLFMMKLDGGGDVQWCKGYDSAPNLWYARQASRIVRDLGGRYVVLANLGIQGYNSPFRPFLMKVDQNGDTLWTRSAGMIDHTYTISDLLSCSDGGLLYNGTAYGDFSPWTGASFLLKSDSLGHLPCSGMLPPLVVVTDLFPVDSIFTLSAIDGAIAQGTFAQDTLYGTIPLLSG